MNRLGKFISSIFNRRSLPDLTAQMTDYADLQIILKDVCSPGEKMTKSASHAEHAGVVAPPFEMDLKDMLLNITVDFSTPYQITISSLLSRNLRKQVEDKVSSEDITEKHSSLVIQLHKPFTTKDFERGSLKGTILSYTLDDVPQDISADPVDLSGLARYAVFIEKNDVAGCFTQEPKGSAGTPSLQ